MPRRPLVALFILVFVVGMAAPAARSASSGSTTLRFNDPVPLSSFSPLRTVMSHVYSLEDAQRPSEHEWSGEPGLEVDPWGTIYVAGVCCVVAASPVWVSRDDGRTFRELATPAHLREWTIGAEGDLEVDDAGRVFFADTTVPTINVTRWSAQGRDWDFTLPAIGVLPVDDRPWLAWTPQYLYLFINHDAFISVYRSSDGGLLWEPMGPLNWRGGVGGFFPGHIAADRKSGAVWVAGAVPKSQVPPGRAETELGSAVSTNFGESYTEAVVYAPRDGEALSPQFTGILTVDDAGYGYTTWSTWTRHGGCSVFFAVSKNHGRSWSRPVRVSSGPGCATFPWIDATSRGRLAVAYYQTPTMKQNPIEPPPVGPPDNPAFQDNVPDDAPWNLRVAYVTGADTRHPQVRDAQVPFDTPLFVGPLDREPWDYLGVDLGRDGVIRVVFTEKYQDSAPRNWFVASRPVA
ncbi:MAG TPA: hypothetical protein VKA30_07755 [Actinomycetota bacterium]|nr:hypothetical protein [Actinomycetota bacterium]